MINLKTSQASILVKHSEVIEVVRHLESRIHGEGRVLLRPSGTEPLLRVMVEGIDKSIVKQQAQQLCDDISRIERNLHR